MKSTLNMLSAVAGTLAVAAFLPALAAATPFQSVGTADTVVARIQAGLDPRGGYGHTLRLTKVQVRALGLPGAVSTVRQPAYRHTSGLHFS